MTDRAHYDRIRKKAKELAEVVDLARMEGLEVEFDFTTIRLSDVEGIYKMTGGYVEVNRKEEIGDDEFSSGIL